MGPVVRNGTVKAPPSTIWNACFKEMKWEIWDPDLERIEDAADVLVDGDSSCTFIMKNGQKLKVAIEAKENERLVFAGKFARGVVRFKGEILLTAKDESTEIQYKFGLSGPVGLFLNVIGKKSVVGGTEKGLENMIKVSEGNQDKDQSTETPEAPAETPEASTEAPASKTSADTPEAPTEAPAPETAPDATDAPTKAPAPETAPDAPEAPEAPMETLVE